MTTIIKCIEQHVGKNRLDHHQGLSFFVDYLIDMFDYRQYLTETGHMEHMEKKRVESPELFTAAYRWVELVKEAQKQKEWVDVFGLTYEEMYQSKSKAGGLGQFFTPPSLSTMLATLTEMQGDRVDNKEICINDSACGSGRLLLAHHSIAKRKDGYYVGEDIDPISVKMCALNMMIHGMRGRSICHDTLMHPIVYDFGYEVNEVRYPYPAPYFSVREIHYTKEDLERDNEERNKEFGDNVKVLKEFADGDMVVPILGSNTKEPEIMKEADGQIKFF